MFVSRLIHNHRDKVICLQFPKTNRIKTHYLLKQTQLVDNSNK